MHTYNHRYIHIFIHTYIHTGCCGAPLSIKFIEKPTPVSCFYNKPTNLALHKKTYQSTTYNMREGKYAVNGKKDGNGVNKSSSTQLESQPWLEVDLGNIATIDKVLIWNRTYETRDKSEVRDLYTSRLFPCWVMIGIMIDDHDDDDDDYNNDGDDDDDNMMMVVIMIIMMMMMVIIIIIMMFMIEDHDRYNKNDNTAMITMTMIII